MEYTSAIQSQAELSRRRPRVHEYVFIENDIVFNENATILLHPYIVFVSFHIVLICPHENDENGKNQRKSIISYRIVSYRIVSYRIEIIWIILVVVASFSKACIFSENGLSIGGLHMMSSKT